ncbi:zinc ABC transporter substrate-binding protein AztC [Streptomyces sp. DSM 44917]|uniref:Zinc ABC transporter substrate-binding protein AztC n=1 Tax=Streptomyces boetiae TaxID=3075541 RepID=A0ABU2LAT0_9ACTN|nr:zinc ABC transporter substrate-binding protein AztC [Streptomyces sp. DSM 44917]MDT0308622.1 zinc ABC transporter substrate-binding protein AztC [Streptomyces sp. DSM 44917]
MALAAGCGLLPADQQSGSSGIVVTTNILGDLTRNIVGDEAEVTVLMGPGADPHSFAISARQAARIEDAGLLIHNGLGLEEGVARNVRAAEEAGVPALAVAEEADPLPFAEEAHETGGGAEEGGDLDPHFWTDPARVRTAVGLIADRVVAAVDGVDADAVRANAQEYAAELGRLDAWMTEEFEAIPPERRSLVTNHHVFGYLAERYGFEVVGAVIPSGTTLASPSAADLEALAGAIREAGVPAVFADSSQPDRLAHVLADEAGVEAEVISLYSESLTGPGQGAATYLEMMRANTEAIVAGLGSGSG